MRNQLEQFKNKYYNCSKPYFYFFVDISFSAILVIVIIACLLLVVFINITIHRIKEARLKGIKLRNKNVFYKIITKLFLSDLPN